MKKWISNCIRYNVWDEITDPSPNFNGATVEVWEWISNFIPHFTGYVITYSYQANSWSTLVKRALYQCTDKRSCSLTRKENQTFKILNQHYMYLTENRIKWENLFRGINFISSYLMFLRNIPLISIYIYGVYSLFLILCGVHVMKFSVEDAHYLYSTNHLPIPLYFVWSVFFYMLFRV